MHYKKVGYFSIIKIALLKAAQSVADSGRVRPARSRFPHALRLDGSLRDPRSIGRDRLCRCTHRTLGLFGMELVFCDLYLFPGEPLDIPQEAALVCSAE